jgi:hypothetical protein
MSDKDVKPRIYRKPNRIMSRKRKPKTPNESIIERIPRRTCRNGEAVFSNAVGMTRQSAIGDVFRDPQRLS